MGARPCHWLLRLGFSIYFSSSIVAMISTRNAHYQSVQALQMLLCRLLKSLMYVLCVSRVFLLETISNDFIVLVMFVILLLPEPRLIHWSFTTTNFPYYCFIG
uniref:Uncharacterized protein n=1 Tax=Cucumis melo TaxID=3656 RepID=A0A9I9ECI5_CUCME